MQQGLLWLLRIAIFVLIHFFLKSSFILLLLDIKLRLVDSQVKKEAVLVKFVLIYLIRLKEVNILF